MKKKNQTYLIYKCKTEVIVNKVSRIMVNFEKNCNTKTDKDIMDIWLLFSYIKSSYKSIKSLTNQ